MKTKLILFSVILAGFGSFGRAQTAPWQATADALARPGSVVIVSKGGSRDYSVVLDVDVKAE